MRLAALMLVVLPASALAQDQAFGIGGRMSMIRGDVEVETGAERAIPSSAISSIAAAKVSMSSTVV